MAGVSQASRGKRCAGHGAAVAFVGQFMVASAPRYVRYRHSIGLLNSAWWNGKTLYHELLVYVLAVMLSGL